MKKVRITVLGLGERGRTMLAEAELFKDYFEVVGACDIQSAYWTTPQDGKAPMKERFPHVELFSDYHTMLVKARPDAVIVETPAEVHVQHSIDALERGIAVLSDIPPVNSLEEGERLWKAASKSKAIFMTGANANEYDFVYSLEDFYKKGLLGKASYLEAEYIHDLRHLFEVTPWRKKYISIKYCTHSLGPLLRVLGHDVLRTVSCISTGSQIVGEDGMHDLMTAHFNTDSGSVVRLTVSFINSNHIGAHSYRIFGTEGYFERFSGRGAILPPKTLVSSTKLFGLNGITELSSHLWRAEFAGKASGSHQGADGALLVRFCKAIRGEADPISARDGLLMSIPGIFAAESAKQNGALLSIKYPWEQ